MNYALAVDYLTLKPGEMQIRSTRSGEAWAEIAPFSIAQATDRGVIESLWPSSGRIGRLIVAPGEAVADAEQDEIVHSFRAWSGSGKESLESGLRVLVNVCRERECELLVWPRLGSLVSDIPGMLSICRKHEDAGIFLEPRAIYPAGGQFQLRDFVVRLAEVLPLPGVRALCFGGFEPIAESELREYVPLVTLASELQKPVVLGGSAPGQAAAFFAAGL